MTIFSITTPTISNSGDAFSSDSAAADTLNVALGAILLATGAGSNAARLSATLAWTVNIDGTLYSAGTNPFAPSAGLKLEGNNSGASKINVNADGSILGLVGIFIGDDAHTGSTAVAIVNRGSIVSSNGAGILLKTAGVHTVTNYGVIESLTEGTAGILENGPGSNDTVVNYGQMARAELGLGTNSFTNNGGTVGGSLNFASLNKSVSGLSGADTVKNLLAGTFEGGVTLDAGTNSLVNEGSIGARFEESYVGLGGSDTVTNAAAGVMSGRVNVGDGTNSLTNAGQIGAKDGASYVGGAGADTVTNTGALDGAVLAGTGGGAANVNKLTNSGTIGADGNNVSYEGGDGADTVTNTSPGSLAGGVHMGAGTNVLTNSGTLGKDGDNNSYVGTDGADTITNAASGTIAGNLLLGNGTNKLDNKGVGFYYQGGSGVDTVINTGTLGTVRLEGGVSNSLSNTGVVDGYVQGGAGNDTVTNTSTALARASTRGDVTLGDGTNSLTNTGGLIGASYPSNVSFRGGVGNDTVTNVNIASARGVLVGGVVLGDGDNVLSNAGDIGGIMDEDSVLTGVAVSGGSGKDTITNTSTGIITSGAITLFNGVNSLTNAGSIDKDDSAYSYLGGDDADTVSNTGVLAGGVVMSMTGTETASKTTVNTLTNSGTIGKNFEGWSYLGGNLTDTVTNSGVLSGGVDMGNSQPIFFPSPTPIFVTENKLTNTATGKIGLGSSLDYVVIGGAGKDTVVNAGLIGGGITLSDGTNLVTNTGTIGHNASGVAYSGGADADTITNAAGKLIDGGILLGDGANSFSNSGTLEATIGEDRFSYLGGGGIDTVTNASTGVIRGILDLGGGATNKLTNSGFVGLVSGGDGKDTIINSGTIHGDIRLGADNDTVTNFVGAAHGRVAGIVNLGDGADSFNGGNNAESVMDGNGADTIKLGGGNDTYIATGSSGTDANDTIDGGAGIDTYDASTATLSVAINIDTVQHGPITVSTSAPLFGYTLAAKTAYGSDVSTSPFAAIQSGTTDSISNFENIVGSTSSTGDVLYGSSGANRIDGLDGDDDIFGFGGNDTLNGGAGGDSIWGELGKDVLSGGAARDIFVYTNTNESTTTARDIITDFSNGDGDRVDLLAIDANTTNTANTNDFFHLIGTNVAWNASDPGALRVIWTALGEILEGDTNGDGKADFAIEFTNDATHAINFSTGVIL